MKRRWLIRAFVSCAICANALAQQAPIPGSLPEIVANVNGLEISKDELLRRADALQAQLPPSEVHPDFYQRVLDQMINDELLYQAVEAKNLAPTQAEIDSEFENQSKGFGGKAAFAEALAKEGISPDQVKRDLQKEIGIQRLVERDLVPQVTVSEEEKRTYYDGNPEEMRGSPEFRVAHILIQVPTDATAEVKEAARKKASALRSMIEVGQDFGDLARRNSGDPGSKDNGGELPWMSKGETVPPFEAAAMALEIGEMSDVVETQFGFHILKLLELRGGDLIPYEQVQGRIEEYLKQLGLQKRLETEVETLRTQGTVEVFI